MESLIERLQRSVIGGALIIGSASVLSRVLGLVRDRILSTEFGTTHILDSYFTAFKVPDVIFNMLVLGALSASFVPVFIETVGKKGRDEAMQMANSLLNILVLALSVLATVCAVLAPQLVALLSYGDTPDEQALTVTFVRMMMISLLFFGMSNVISGMLHAQKKFFVYAIAPIFYNIGIIFGILVLVPAVGNVGLALGVVLGSALHVCVQLPAVWRTGFRYRLTINWKDRGVRKILQLMPPRAFSLGLTQLNTIIIFALASTLEDGSRAVWQFAENLQYFPINIFGVSLSLAVFPLFSEAFAENNMTRFRTVFSENVRRVLFFIIPISIATLLLRAQIVRLVYGAGEFDWDATVRTAQTLGTFALSMFAQGLIPLLARAFFAKQDTKTPVVVTAIGLVLNVGLGLWLSRTLGITGLALGFSIASIVQMMLLFITLRIRHGDLEDDRIIASTWKIVAASLGMGLIIQGLKYLVAPMVDMQTFVGVFIQTAVAVIGGGMAYLFIAFKFAFTEARMITDRLWAMGRAVRKAVSS
jgi:putative peptidoglycan lipid II flippase